MLVIITQNSERLYKCRVFWKPMAIFRYHHIIILHMHIFSSIHYTGKSSKRKGMANHTPYHSYILNVKLNLS